MGEIFDGFVVPIVSGVILGGLTLLTMFYVWKGFKNAWRRSWKFFFKYKFLFGKKKYPDEVVEWAINCFEKNIDYYKAKQELLLNGVPEKEVDELMWMFIQTLNQLNKEKGGNTNGRKFKRCNSKTETTTKFTNFNK